MTRTSQKKPKRSTTHTMTSPILHYNDNLAKTKMTTTKTWLRGLPTNRAAIIMRHGQPKASIIIITTHMKAPKWYAD